MVLRLVILLIALGVGWQVHPSLELVALGDILQPPRSLDEHKIAWLGS